MCACGVSFGVEFLSLFLFAVPIYFDVYVGWCCSFQFAHLIVTYRRIYFVHFSFVVLVLHQAGVIYEN